MQEKGNEHYSFINERRKEKPINKKKLLVYAGFIVVMAVVFGLLASLVMAWFQPRFEDMLYPEEAPVVKIPQDDYPDVTETESESEEEASETGASQAGGTIPEDTEEASTAAEDSQINETENTESAAEQGIKEITLEDFQKIHNQLYDVGREANRFIVTVTSVKSDKDWFQNDYQSKDQASGVVIADNGTELLILTDCMTILGAQGIYVTFCNEFSARASMKKYDGNTGITILSVPIEELDDKTKEEISVAVLGNSLITKQGELAIAVGSLLGTNYSILTGNITSITKNITTIDRKYTVFTTDIVGNDSGSGVLINVSGEVIGLVMQQYRDGDGNTLTAVSISELKSMIEMLSNGRDMPYIGVVLTTVTDAIADEYDIPKGAYIKEVVMDSPAMAAGLQSGDVITEMGGDVIFTVDGFSGKLLSLTPGETIEIVVKRQGADGYTNIPCAVEIGVLQ